MSGRIPSQLTNLTFLEVLRFSNNNLVGPIPSGKQFDTFEDDSYLGNLGLCGLPLSKECNNDEIPEPAQDEEDNGNGIAFIWKLAMMGYGCGMVLGISMAYIVFTTGRPWWLVHLFTDGAVTIGNESASARVVLQANMETGTWVSTTIWGLCFFIEAEL
ncbi:hypothetical protein Goshw_002359 [Gossypium schwendimanii]|uniref:Uncharacterized protein n=1 Tax=Gossypium schwendimanii TaxID=34291 RepID=A0A7J9N6E0_GOSSC|nr:hypothetical protein [Gossypium schwendimanii]